MDQTYLVLKCIHILGVVLFLGNIIVTAWWKTMTDFVFTGGGVLLIIVGGVGNTTRFHMDLVHTPWLYWGRWLFTASGLIWIFVLIPVQIMQARIARGFESGGPIPIRYWRLGRIWMTFGVTATLLPLANLYWMVFKPNS